MKRQTTQKDHAPFVLVFILPPLLSLLNPLTCRAQNIVVSPYPIPRSGFAHHLLDALGLSQALQGTVGFRLWKGTWREWSGGRTSCRRDLSVQLPCRSRRLRLHRTRRQTPRRMPQPRPERSAMPAAISRFASSLFFLTLSREVVLIRKDPFFEGPDLPEANSSDGLRIVSGAM